jgi:hypothetical protein
VGRAPIGSAVGPWGERRDLFMRDIFILTEIWAQDKIYCGRHLAWLKYEACFPNVAHSYRKRRLKWVPIAWRYSWVTLSPRVTNTENWSSRLGVGRGVDSPTP